MKLDLFFSIGPACRPAYYLKMNFLRTFASPLDWQMSYSLDTCLHLFQTGFRTFFSEIREDPHRKGAHENRRILDTLNSITSIHHFDSRIPLDDALAGFHSVMQRRYEQLHAAILKAHTVGLVCNREEPLDCLSAFLSSFGQIYPDTGFILINIRNQNEADSISMQEYTLNARLAIKEYTFRDIYPDTEYREEREWLGCPEKWNSILQDYCVTQHPLAQCVEKAISLGKSVRMYGAGLYCHKLIHFLEKYNLNVSGILVTPGMDNPDSVEGIPVASPKDIPEAHRDDLVIISVTDIDESLKIRDQLKSEGFTSIVRIDSLLRILP